MSLSAQKKRLLIRAVIFDVDGVLVDTVPLHFRAWKKVFAEEKIPFNKKEYQRINGIPRDAGVRMILGARATADRIRDIGDRKQHHYLASLASHPPLALPGIRSLLTALRHAGVRMAAASSSKNAAAVLAGAHLTRFFDAIITGHDFQHPKPHPDIFLTAARALGVKPGAAAVVEDAANGVRAARTGGFYCVGIAGSESAHDLTIAGASIVVSKTRALTLNMFHAFSSF